MPIKACQKDNKPGYKFGDRGHCYTYTRGDEESRKRAHEKARKQGAAEHVESVSGTSAWLLAAAVDGMAAKVLREPWAEEAAQLAGTMGI